MTDLVKTCSGCKTWTVTVPADMPQSEVEKRLEAHLRECPPLQRLYLIKNRIN